jgi:hypothetical protein
MMPDKFFINMGLTRIFHVFEVYICKAFKGAAVVDYCKALITKQMGVADTPIG